MNKPDFIRTPDASNTITEYNLKAIKSLIIPTGAGFVIDGLQDTSGHIYLRINPITGKVLLQLYAAGAIVDFSPKGDFVALAFSGEYADIKNRPDLSEFLTSVSWGNVTDKPTFKTVATSGKYSDLTGAPDLSGFLTSVSWDSVTSKPTFKAVATSGKYSDLTDPPTIPVLNDTLDTVCQRGHETTSYIVAQTFYKTSLRSAKKQIKDYLNDALATINKLRVRTFKYKKSVEHQIGFIIDEIQDPNLINNSGTAINTDSMLAVVVKSLQQLSKRVEALENDRMA
jgi:hypothetical protein